MLAQKASAKGIDLVSYIDPSVPAHLFSDPVRVKQILFNLLSNAVKFTHVGIVALKLSARQLPCLPVEGSRRASRAHSDSRPVDGTAPHASPSAHAPTPSGGGDARSLRHCGCHGSPPNALGRCTEPVYELHFEVIDTGIGIPQAAQSRLFHSFAQGHRETNRLYGGTGLGLAISKLLVELLAGSIEFTSVPEVGSHFHCILPMRTHNGAEPAQTAITTPALWSDATPRSPLHSLLLPASGSLEPSVSSVGPPVPLGSVSLQSADRLCLQGCRVLLLHRQPLALQLLSTMLADWGVDVVAVSSVAEIDARRAAGKDASLLCLCVDLPSLLQDPSGSGSEHSTGGASPNGAVALSSASAHSHGTSLLSRLYHSCQSSGTPLVLLIPLGAQRRKIIECADEVITHPIKAAQMQALMIRLMHKRNQRDNNNHAEQSSAADTPTNQSPGSPWHADPHQALAVERGVSAVPALHLPLTTPTVSPLSSLSSPRFGDPQIAASMTPAPSDMDSVVSIGPAPLLSTEASNTGNTNFPPSAYASFAANYPMRILIAEGQWTDTAQQAALLCFIAHALLHSLVSRRCVPLLGGVSRQLCESAHHLEDADSSWLRGL